MKTLAALPLLQIFVLLSVTATLVLAYVDEERESAEALSDFAQEQANLAQAVANGLRGTLPSSGEKLMDEAGRMALPHSRLILVRPPGTPTWNTTDGRTLLAPQMSEALQRGQAVLKVQRAEAVALGLPERMALAGLAQFDAGSSGRWAVAVVTTAERERNRERRARWRLVLAIALAVAFVTALGGTALERQRRELELSRNLAVTRVERERDERLERLNKAVMMTTLASGVAHEVATPLAVIAGHAEQVLKRVSSDEKSAQGVRVILEQADRIQQTVRGFLDLARGGSPAFERVDPTLLIAGAISLVEHRFARAQVDLHHKLSTDLAPVRGSPRLLEHALVNLLINSCDACIRGGQVEIKAQADGSKMTFTVSDDGEGISPDTVRRVMEPFFTTKVEGRGTGLGLALVNEIVKSHGGTFGIEPNPPHGTRAHLTIFLSDGDFNAAAKS